MADPYLIDLQPGDDEITRDIVIQRWLKNISDLVVGEGFPPQAGNSGKFITTNGSAVSWSFVPISTGVSGLGTNVATFLATPTSANLLAAVSDETGTGALVFANTPTLVTPILGVASGTSITLSSLTTTRVPFASTAGLLIDSSAFTFVTGTGQLTATSFALGLTTPGVISGASGAITLTAAGTNQNITLTPSGTGYTNLNGTTNGEALRVTTATGYVKISTFTPSSGGGVIAWNAGSNLGLTATNGVSIGFAAVATPTNGLVVNGHTLLGGLTTDGTGVLQFPVATTSAGGITFGTDVNFFRQGNGILAVNYTGGDPVLKFFNNGTIGFQIQTNGTAGLLQSVTGIEFRTNAGTTALTLDSSQNATFAHKVTVNGGTTSADGLFFGADTGFYRVASGNLAMLGTGSGDIGISLIRSAGTSTNWQFYCPTGTNSFVFRGGSGPTDTLTLDASANATFAHKVTLNSAGGTTTADALFFGTDAALYRVSTGYLGITKGASGNSGLNFYDNTTLYGTVDINSFAFQLSSAGAGGILLRTSGSTAITVLNATSTGIKFNGYGAGAITSDASGNLTAVSDERLKRDIRPYSRGLSEILALNPILHGYNAKSGLDQKRDDYAGFSAQNVMKSIPEAVATNPDGFYSFSDRPVTAALVNAIKELTARLETLEARKL